MEGLCTCHVGILEMEIDTGDSFVGLPEKLSLCPIKYRGALNVAEYCRVLD